MIVPRRVLGGLNVPIEAFPELFPLENDRVDLDRLARREISLNRRRYSADLALIRYSLTSPVCLLLSMHISATMQLVGPAFHRVHVGERRPDTDLCFIIVSR